MVNKNLYTLLVCLLLAGCDLIDYHPYDVRISGETDVNAHNIEQIEAKCKGKTTIRFITMGDSQRWYDETEDFVKEVNKRDDIDFVIHGGDMSDFGLTKEFLWQRDIMNGLKVPYVVLIGNHDCLGTGAETYQAVFGPTNFSFIAGNVKFVCLNTNALEYDYSEPIPNFGFMEQELTDRADEFEKTVVSMHILLQMCSMIMWRSRSSTTSPNIRDYSSARPPIITDSMTESFLMTMCIILSATA